MSALTRGQVAQMAGVGPETVRYYEREGILQTPPRRPNGYRSYPTEAVRRILFVKRARALGFSLAEVKGLLALADGREGTCGAVRHQAEVKLEQVEEKIRSLERIREALRSLLEECDEQDLPVSQCPILESLQPGQSEALSRKN